MNLIASYLAWQARGPTEVARAMDVVASRAHNRIQTGWKGVNGQVVARHPGLEYNTYV